MTIKCHQPGNNADKRPSRAGACFRACGHAVSAATLSCARAARRSHREGVKGRVRSRSNKTCFTRADVWLSRHYHVSHTLVSFRSKMDKRVSFPDLGKTVKRFQNVLPSVGPAAEARRVRSAGPGPGWPAATWPTASGGSDLVVDVRELHRQAQTRTLRGAAALKGSVNCYPNYAASSRPTAACADSTISPCPLCGGCADSSPGKHMLLGDRSCVSERPSSSVTDGRGVAVCPCTRLCAEV